MLPFRFLAIRFLVFSKDLGIVRDGILYGKGRRNNLDVDVDTDVSVYRVNVDFVLMSVLGLVIGQITYRLFFFYTPVCGSRQDTMY